MLSLTKAKKKKWPPLLCSPPPRSPFLLDKYIECVLSFIYLSRAWFVSDPVTHGFSPCMGQDMCLLYVLWDAEKREGGLECWCPLVPHSSVWDCVCVCVFNAGGRGPLLFSGKCWEQEATRRDGHHDSNSNWMGCTVNAPWPRACGQTPRQDFKWRFGIENPSKHQTYKKHEMCNLNLGKKFKILIE